MASRVDANQKAIVAALRACGATVFCTHTAAHGFVDLVCGYHGVNYLIEVKGPRGKLTPDQRAFHATWRGRVDVVRSVDEALRVVGATAPERC